MEILKVENLTKIYGKGNTKVTALDNVSFSVEKGEFVAIVGASGSGKSTLLHILGGVDRPTSGKVIVDKEDIYKLNEANLAIFRRRQVGLIYQFYNLIPILNIEENITLPILLDGRKVDKEYLNELINILGLEKRLNHLPNELSGGEQQRVAIARAIAKNPKLLLCDEPTGALDYKTGKQILKLLQDTCKKEKMTVIIITHNTAIAPMADKVIHFKNGMAEKIEINENPISIDNIEW